MSSLSTVQQWQQKADSDMKIGQDEFVTEEPATDAICFHMQQCVEKYLKSFLLFRNCEIPHTHNLAHILHLCIEQESTFEELNSVDVDQLTDYAVSTRYPDDFYVPTAKETAVAIACADKVRAFVRNKTGRIGNA